MTDHHVTEVEKAVFNDLRGSHVKFFGKSPEKIALPGVDLKEVFMTVNNSGVLRGLHYQVDPPQPKLLTCVTGSAVVVTVCLSHNSKTFGSWDKRILTADLTSKEGQAMIYVPANHALGYYITENNTRMLYMAGADFSSIGDVGIDPFDEELAIDWGPGVTRRTAILSQRDENLPKFAQVIREMK